MSALFAAGRYAEILVPLDLAPYKSWHYRQWGVKALRALTKNDEALRYAEESRGMNEPDWAISTACERETRERVQTLAAAKSSTSVLVKTIFNREAANYR